jgi:hypothetical protein
MTNTTFAMTNSVPAAVGDCKNDLFFALDGLDNGSVSAVLWRLSPHANKVATGHAH